MGLINMQLTNMIGAWAIGWCWKLAMAVLVMGFALLYPSYERYLGVAEAINAFGKDN